MRKENIVHVCVILQHFHNLLSMRFGMNHSNKTISLLCFVVFVTQKKKTTQFRTTQELLSHQDAISCLFDRFDQIHPHRVHDPFSTVICRRWIDGTELATAAAAASRTVRLDEIFEATNLCGLWLPLIHAFHQLDR